MRYEGRCHCGNLGVTFETALAPEAIPLRACQCTFCRKHGATWTADPAGALAIHVADQAQLSRYRFGLGTSEFLVCRRCGVVAAAVATIDGRLCGALNANALDARDALTAAPEPVDYDRESADERVARRRSAWMPATVR